MVYRDELTAGQLAYLASPTGRQIMRRAADEAGFVLEERAEGFLLVDPDAVSTDTKFPDDSSTACVIRGKMVVTHSSSVRSRSSGPNAPQSRR